MSSADLGPFCAEARSRSGGSIFGPSCQRDNYDDLYAVDFVTKKVVNK